jgi:rSAM/selenodomain-associated transferase 1
MSVRKKKTAIIIFAKLPVEGKVKTRLAKDVGDKFAVSFYKVCAEHTFSELMMLKESGADLFLFCSEENEIEQVKDWVGDNYNCYSQQGNDLGKRMLNAFELVFKKGYNKVIIVGTDAPDISADLVQKAFSSLDKNSCVIGPASDGGYYLLGFNSEISDVFSGIEWSTSSVFDKTLEMLKHIQKSYYVLDELTDIDTKSDLQSWITRFDGSANHTVKEFVESSNIHIM